ncbi:MAG: hypothetical protein KGJ07_10250 [Patescibacteria group bacterium]|nr:hypothetical protein [Patescibacteria group bacterium]
MCTTPTPSCHYETLCPKIACAEGTKCPTCAPTLVCPTPGVSNGGVGVTSSGQIEVIEGKSVKAAETGPSVTEDQQGEGRDLCRELPQRFIDCTVSPDGTYLCSATNVAPFTSASIAVSVPSYFYKVTSKNPVIISQPTATVDFGLAPSGIVAPQNNTQGLTSGTKQAFTVHVNGVVAGFPVVIYVTESKNGPGELSGVFTTDASGNIVLKVTPNDSIVMVPVVSKGYKSILPQRLEVTVSKNSCGLDTPCVFTATQ